MDLILWRHADAEFGGDDLARELTPKGRKQATRVAEWLLQRLPEGFKLIASPAARAQQTARALNADFETVESLAPGASRQTILQEAGWPAHGGTVVVVGHQPDLGRAVAYLLSRRDEDMSIKKGGLWWLRSRERDDDDQVVVRAAVSPDLL